MHPIFNRFFLLGSLSYISIQFTRWQKCKIPVFINNYLTDFLFIPLLLMFTLFLLRIIKREKVLKLNVTMLLVSVVFTSFVFEYYLPQKSNIYTSDMYDVFVYGLGGVSFYFLQQKMQPVRL